MAEVCLVYMPYGAVEKPSIALGILKAALLRAGISARVLYPTFWFAEEIGVGRYDALGTAYAEQIGEWTFAGEAFPDFVPDHEVYLERIAQVFEPDDPAAVRRIAPVLHDVRKQARPFIERVVAAVLAEQPKIVACSSMFQQHCASLALLRRLRECAPDIISVLGGANCEGPMGRTTVEHFNWIDFAVSGEADLSFPALCQLLIERGRDLALTDLPPGVMRAERHTRSLTRALETRARVEQLDATPAPDYEEYFSSLRCSSIAARVKPALLLETSRGCWWGAVKHCTFCGLNGSSMAFRSKSADRAVTEFLQLSRQYETSRIQVVDNILDMKYFDEVLPRLAAAPEALNIFYETKSNLKRRHVETLHAAGVSWIQPGIESLNDAALQLMNKGVKAATNVQLLKWSRELGIHVSWNILYGFPGEHDVWFEEMAQWLPKLVHLQPPQVLIRIRFERFSPYHQRPEQYALKLQPAWPYSYVYPLDSAALSELAYMFDAETTSAATSSAKSRQRAAEDPPGIRALRDVISTWHTLHRAQLPPLLCMEEQKDHTRIFDSRPDGNFAWTVLEGLAHHIHARCDHAMTLPALLQQLAETELVTTRVEVERMLGQLCEQRLLHDFSGRYLRLALAGDVPAIPRAEDFPGGYVEIRSAFAAAG